jgi:hypothetical protein
MSLNLDINDARQADRLNSSIRESGKYIGVITRAEKLLSEKNTEGLGISFKTDDGATANYLDLYTVNAKGEKLPSMATVQAILCCTKTKSANEGNITFKAWDKVQKKEVDKTANGYPDLMGKRIGLLLQRELSDNPKDSSKPNDRVVVYGVFEAETGFTASEILDKATKPEKLDKMLQVLMAKPFNDRRTNKSAMPGAAAPSGNGFDEMDDDIPW